ncbi:MAG: DMT family transporter [Bacillota bacterium]|jgi:paired small multidrug resistance pump
MAWFLLIIAGACEVLGVTSLKIYTELKKASGTNFKKRLAVLGAIIFWTLAFVLLAIVFRELPVAIAYAVWTGIGGIGSTIVAAFFFKERMGMLKVFCLSAIIIGLIGLRIFTS